MYVEDTCRFEVGGDEGWINSTNLPKQKLDFIVEHNLQLDCMWVITVQEGWKVNFSSTIFMSSASFILIN